MGGWIPVERDALERIGFQNSALIALYCYLLANAAYTARSEAVDGMEIELRPGDTVVTRSRLAAAMKAPEATCYHRLKRLAAMGLISYVYTAGAKHSIVTIPGSEAENVDGSIDGGINGGIDGGKQPLLNTETDGGGGGVNGGIDGGIDGNVNIAEGARVIKKENKLKTKKEINKERKDETDSVAEELRHGLNALFRRRETTVWSDKERARLAAISKRPDAAEEFRLIEAHYRSGYKYCHKAIETLLNNWNTALDRAGGGGGGGEERRTADSEYGF